MPRARRSSKTTSTSPAPRGARKAGPRPKSASADDLFRAVRGTNPFQSNRVSSPDDVRVDVGQVHGAAFEKVIARIEEVRHGKSSSGILLVGGPGFGKSHVLGRVARWARDNAAAFVFLHNLQASPERMARYVLKAAISAVFAAQGPVSAGTGLFALLVHAIDRHEGALRRQGKDDPVDPEIGAVLDTFRKLSADSTRQDLTDAAFDWMCGDEIDEELAKELGKLAGRKISTRLPDGAAVERVLIVLARLLAFDDKVLVLCLDQIDNLDGEQVRSLMAFLHALIDHGQHIAVICAGVRTSMYQLRDERVIPEAAWDRVAEHTVELQVIAAEQARSLIAARAEDFLRPFAALPALTATAGRDPLFPLGEPWFQRQFGQKLQLRPRDVVTWARDEWERVQQAIEKVGGPAWLAAWPGKGGGDGRVSGNGGIENPAELPETLIDKVVRAKVEEGKAQRTLSPESLPPDADNLAKLTVNLLTRCLGHPEYSIQAIQADRPKKGPAPFTFVITERSGKGKEARTGVLCLPGGHGNLATKALERVHQNMKTLDHVLLVTDRRRDARLGARGQEYYDQLIARGNDFFRHIQLTFEEVVHLDALDSVLGLARVGDLEIEHPRGVPRPVSEPEAVRSMHRQRLFLAHPFLHELLTEGDDELIPPPPSPELPPDPVVRAGIADYLEWRTGAAATEVGRKLAEDHPAADKAGLLAQVIRLADLMHGEGRLHSTPEGPDRFLLWRGAA